MQLGIDRIAAIIPAQQSRDLLEEITSAHEVGVDAFGVGEHHRPEFLDSAPTIILVAATARAKRIQFSSAVTVLCAAEPVRVFHEFATVDLLSQGRAQLDALRSATCALFISDAETVVERIVCVLDAPGSIDRLNLQMTVAALPHGRMRRAIELLGTRVAPLVRDALATSMRIAAVVLSLAFLAGCGKNEAPPSPPPPKVVVARPVAKKIVERSEYTGRLAAVEEVEVRPRVSGYIFEIKFKDGTLVKKGDPLFVIDPRPYQASLGQAQGQLKEALAAKALSDSNYERAKTLDATRVTSKQEFDTSITSRNQSDAKVATAQAAVDSAQLNLDFTRITAPIDGRVSREQVTVGNLVAPDTTLLTTIVSVDPVYAYADVDERTVIAYKKMIREGKVKDARDTPVEVGIALAGEKGFPHKGVIDFVDSKIASATGTLSIRGLFPNSDDSLLPGMFIRMEIPTSPTHDGLLVTDRAVGSDQGQKFLLVVKGDKVEQKPVTLGPVIDGLRVVTGGLDPGDQVIVSGVMKAQPGAQVTVEQGDMTKFASDQLEAVSMAGGSGK